MKRFGRLSAVVVVVAVGASVAVFEGSAGARPAEGRDESREDVTTSRPTSTGGSTAAEPTPSGATAAAGGSGAYHPLVPARVLDTREAVGLPAALGDGGTADLQITGRGGVPVDGVGAVVLNLTATNATRASFVTAWPAGQARPLASNLNVVAGDTVPNLVIVPVGAGGKVSLYNNDGTVDLVADVEGWFPVDAAYVPLTPARIMDSRLGQGTARALGDATAIDLHVAGQGGVPASGAGAVVVNITATDPTFASFVTAWPSGMPRPVASNLNVGAGQTVANLAIVPLGANGQISLYNNNGSVDLIADVQGWFPAGSDYTSMSPSRILDTRDGLGVAASLAEGASADLQVTGRGGVPAGGVAAVVMNLTATNPTGATFVTAWPAGQDRPLASNLNVRAGQTAPNLVVVPVGADGKVSLYNNHGTVDLVADVQGWFPQAVTGHPGGPEQWEPELAAGWQFVPQAVTLLADDQAATLRLALVDADGNVTATPVPAGTTFTTSGQTDSATVTTHADGTIDVVASSTVFGALTIGAAIPGQQFGPSAAVTNARLQPGVHTLSDDQIVFPPPLHFDETATPNPDDLIGPFTMDELAARIVAPADGPISQDAFFNPTIQLPVVLSGSAPAAGTIVASTGATPVYGMVVEPDGLPTLTRDGSSLVAVQQLPLNEVFDELELHYSSDDMVAQGVLAGGERFELRCPSLDCEDLDDIPTTPIAYLPGDGPPPGTSAGSADGTAADSSGSAANALRPEAAPGLNELLYLDNLLLKAVNACRSGSSFGASLADLKLLDLSIELGPFLDMDVALASDENRVTLFNVEAGFRASMSGGPSGKFQLAISGRLQCVLKKFLDKEFIPANPIVGSLLTANLTGHYDGILELTAAGGPSFSFSVTCIAKKTMSIGFNYNEATGFQPFVHNPDMDVQCGQNQISVEGSADLDQFSLEAGIGPAVVFDAGIRIGGVFSRIVSLVGSWTLPTRWSIGQVGLIKIISATLWGRLHAGWENNKFALGAGKASSHLGVDAQLKVDLSSFEPLGWLARKLSLGLVSGDLSIASVKIDVVSLYKPLNNQTPTVVVNGEQKPAGSTIEVEPGDDIVLSSTMSVPTSTFPTPAPQIIDGTDWFLGDDLGYDQLGLFTLYEQIPPFGTSGSTLKATGQITTATCVKLGQGKSRRVAVLAKTWLITSFLEVPGYAGSFRLMCKDPKLEWSSPTAKMSFDLDQMEVLRTLKGTAVKGWEWTLDDPDDPSDDKPDWIESIEPIDGTFHIQQPSEETITITGDCDGQAGKLLTHTFTATARPPGAAPDDERHATADLAVELDCRHGWVKATPATINSSTTLTITSKGADEQEWAMSGIPEWEELEVETTEGEFAAGESTLPDAITLSIREPLCELQPTATAVVTIDGGIRGSAQFTLVRRAVPADPSPNCKPPEAHATGDPHLASFDGVYYEAQVRGEYIFTRTVPVSDDGVEVHARIEPSQIGSITYHVTSITATAVRVGDHTVEVYAAQGRRQRRAGREDLHRRRPRPTRRGLAGRGRSGAVRDPPRLRRQHRCAQPADHDVDLQRHHGSPCHRGERPGRRGLPRDARPQPGQRLRRPGWWLIHPGPDPGPQPGVLRVQRLVAGDRRGRLAVHRALRRVPRQQPALHQ